MPGQSREEEPFSEGEAGFRTLADSIPNLAWWANADGYISWYNRRWYEYTGATPAQMAGWGWQSVHDPGVLPKVLEHWKASIATRAPFEMTFPLRGTDGVFRPFLTRVVPLKDDQGRVLSWFGTNTEISGQKQVEQALRLNEARLDAIISSAMDAIISINSEQRMVLFNRAAEKMFGLSAGKAIGESINRFIPERFREAHTHHVESFGCSGVTSRSMGQLGALTGVRSNGEEFPIQASISHIEVGGEKLFTVILRDTTTQKLAEEALARSEQRYRSFVEASSQVIWRTNARGEVDEPIPSWAAYTGQSDGETRGFGWMNAIRPEDRPRVTEAWKHASATRTVYRVEYCLKRHDGQWRHILARGVPVLEANGEVREYIGTCIDVTEQRDAEAAAQKQARLIDLAPAATMIRTLEGTISYWSEGAERLYGWTRQEAAGRLTHELLRTEFPESLDKVVEHLRHGGKWSGELRHRTKDGRPVIVESHWLGQFNSEGAIAELLESNTDITDRKRDEEDLRRLKDQLELRVQERTAELLAANKGLEAFGYSVSHDLRAPLRHIDSYINMLQKDVGPRLDEKNQRQVRIIAEAARRMGNLIEDLLVLSRLGRATMEERAVDLGRLVDEVRQELAPAIAGRSIEWHVGPLPRVQADPNLLRSAVSNLLANAIKYTRQRNPARIEVGGQEEDGEVICFVRDNGAGFDMRFVAKLFGVFQRLHAANEFEGTGIGLASVRRVIQRHGGRTWAEGEVGKGATFYFSLPRSRVLAETELEHRSNGAGR
jgi:PAS domain S-box-containing protein